MPKRTKNYEAGLVEDLRDPEYAIEYLNAVLEDDSPGAEGRFLLALRFVAKAQDVAMKHLAEKVKASRQSLYNTLSKKGNPEFHTLNATVKALGLKLMVQHR